MQITTLRRTTLVSLLAFAAVTQAEPPGNVEQYGGGPHVPASYVELLI
ncbi:MAG: hypothetical protein P4L79_12385 [Legionella sp.]|nr:hypothetical protein [Legionella sp.]